MQLQKIMETKVHRKIEKLHEAVINRIAAGEVVQRPSAALKEMLENSLDASSTSITVIAKGGGMQLLQIIDNGHGIVRDDMVIACERFTTSKLTNFDDLKSISTFGFRGEALASITHVARVTILTRTKAAPCAFKASYLDGKLVPSSANDKAEPKPAAGTIGTTITVEDLFYNMPTRKQAFKNLNDEYQRILDVVTKYSIHYGDKKISFTCKKYGQNVPDLHCPVTSSSSSVENIKIAYGSAIARELVAFSVNTSSNSNSNDKLIVSVNGQVTNANYSHKRPQYIFFINNRLVECGSIRRTVESVYSEILPKHAHPFVYLSIHMPPQHIDVNVHPTKKEVHFLFEDELLELIHVELTKLLGSANESRTFLVQSTLLNSSNFMPSNFGEDRINKPDIPTTNTASTQLQSKWNAIDDTEAAVGIPFSHFESNYSVTNGEKDSEGNQVAASGAAKSTRSSAASGLKRAAAPSSSSTFTGQQVRANKMVRTDHYLQKINSFFVRQSQSASNVSADATKLSGINDNDVENMESQPRIEVPNNQSTVPFSFAKRKSSSCICCEGEPNPSKHGPTPLTLTTESSASFKLPSPIIETACSYTSIQDMISEIHKERSKPIEHILKNNSFVGAVSRSLSLIQWGTKLLLVNHSSLLRSLFYQLAIRKFAEHPNLILQEGVNVEEFVRAALERDSGLWSSKEQDGDINLIAKGAAVLLWHKKDMLMEYFSIGLENRDGVILLKSLPLLLENYEPLPEELPEFLVRLSACTDWKDERGCFDTIALQLAEFYSKLPYQDDEYSDRNGSQSTATANERISSLLEGLVYPALRVLLIPSEKVTPRHEIFIEIAALEHLYKIFERC